jgi:uncharacterized protein (TIGR03435 family)
MSDKSRFRLNFAKNLLNPPMIAASTFLVAIALMITAAIRAQSPPSQPRPTFGVASVKPFGISKMNCGNCDHYGHQLTAERFVDRTSLVTYIVAAYGFQHFCMQKVGVGEDCPLFSGKLPVWVNTDRWEIQAKLPLNIPLPTNLASYSAREGLPPQVRLMLQVLLEDRFQLKVHRETKELPVYVLTVGENGPKLKPTPPNGELETLADGNVYEHHGFSGSQRVSTEDGTMRVRYAFRASSMQEAANNFSASVDRPVLDRTGLTGDYDFDLEFQFEIIPGAPRLLPGRFPDASALSTSLQDVGLRLVPTKAPVEFLVIDRVEKPSEN